MAGSTYDVLVNLLGNTAGFSNAMKKAQWDAAALGQKMQAIGGIMSNVGRSMTMYVTVPIVAGMALATKAAIDEEKEMALLAEAMRKNADATQESIDATESWITAQQNATGIADGELRPALATLVAATKDVGEAQDLLAVAMDISAAKGKPLETVVAGLQKAYLGNVGALGRLGIATKDAEGKTLTFDQVMKNAIATYGGAASVAAETTAGKFAILKAKMMDLVETVGAMLIPFVQKAVDLLTKLADWASNLPPVWQQVGVALAAAAAAAGPILMVLGKLLTVVGAIMGIAGGGWIALIIAAIAAIAAGLAALYAKSETFRTFVNTMWGEFVGVVQNVVAVVVPLLQELWAAIVDGYNWMVDNVDWAALWAELQPALQAAQELLVTFVQTMVTGISTIVGFIRDNWSTIGPIVKGAMDVSMAAIQTFFAVVTPLFQAVAALLRGDWSDAWDHAKTVVARMAEGIGTIMNALVTLIGRLAVAAMKALWEAFKDGVEKAVEWVAGLPGKATAALSTLASELKAKGVAGMAGLWNGLKDKWSDVIGWVQSIPGKVGNAFSGAATWLYNEGYSIISGLLNGIKAAWEAVATYLSGLAGKIADLKGPISKDRTLLIPQGRAIMDGLLAGMKDGAVDVLDFAAGLSPSLSGTMAVGAAPAYAMAAGGGGNTNVTINVDARGSSDPAAVEAAAQRGAKAAIAMYAQAKRMTRKGSGR